MGCVSVIMPLVANTLSEETPDQKLAKEARARLTEYASTTLIVYSNLMNYRHNAGVTPAQFDKALGTDLKEFQYILKAMRRMLLKLNPDVKPQLKEMVLRTAK